MKLIFLILCIGFFSAAVFGRDLSSIARKERARRQSLRISMNSKAFTNDDLDAYAKHPTQEPSRARRETHRTAGRASRDLRKEESHWRGEKLRHDRELARIDANIRRLEWRLHDRQSKSRAKNRIREDPGVTLIEESLASLRDEREQLETEFRERARKAGALPGWLR